MIASLRRTITVALPPVLLFVVLVALWQIVTVVGNVPAYIVPQPKRVFQTAILNTNHRWQLFQATQLTAAAALCGLGLSLVIGLLTALIFSQSGMIRRSLYPYAIFLQTVPSVALAPLVIIWFGTGFTSVVVVALVISLFPIITNMTTGLLAVDHNLLELFEMSNASRFQTLLKLRLPNSIPYLITGARISCGLSVIGAIVGELSAGYNNNSIGLGYLIMQTSGRSETDYLFAATLAAMLLGVVMFVAISLLGNLILKICHSDSGQPESLVL